jgi:enoyl-CoA hydratase/carnithine racemase
MMLTGRAVSTEEALQIGLINRVAAADISLIDQAVEYLESITQYSKTAINAIRHSAAESGAQLSDYGLEIEKDWVERVAQSEDAHEGVAAFRKKRKPIFKHR